MRGMVTAVVALGLAVPAAAQSGQSVQQAFEAATALSDQDRNAEALAAWQALEARVGDNPRNAAIVRVREGQTLLALDRSDEAVAKLHAGLDALPTGDATLAQDRAAAWQSLGAVAEHELDYAGAATDYRAALALVTDPLEKLAMLRGLIQAEIFTDPAGAATDLAAAQPLLAAAKSEVQTQANFLTLQSELALNTHDLAGARKAASAAVAKEGGLTDRIAVKDVPARSDYAIAALLAGDDEDARKYMAYSGAGQMSGTGFAHGIETKVPDCGGEDHLRPDDAAVIEFSVGDDGRVIGARPIYAAGGGAAGIAFARAARDWSWDAGEVKAMSPFFRYFARIELRCSTQFERPSVDTYLDQELSSWLETRHVTLPPPQNGSDAALVAGERARLAADEAHDPNSAQVLADLDLLMANAVVGREERLALARRALAITVALKAPPTARLAVEQLSWLAAQADSWKPANYQAALRAGMGDPYYANDPAARAALRLLLADAVRDSSRANARTLLQQVAGDAALAENDPLRVAALVRTASLDVADGKPDAARAAFDQTGLAADQCALLDTEPHMLASNVGGEAFPKEAQRWGFEGWVRMQYDISANGRTANPRVVASYPPFVFDDAGKGMVGDFAYAKSYRPDGGLGCGGETSNIRFQLPDR